MSRLARARAKLRTLLSAAILTRDYVRNARSSSIIGCRGSRFLRLMISLCPGCQAKVHRTIAVLTEVPPLLLELWREQHREGHEQTVLQFRELAPAARAVPLFGAESKMI